ncbi:MAG: type II toxin-antitoxin system RelB family antitoxin [Gammaproteobacteria bacterium]
MKHRQEDWFAGRPGKTPVRSKSFYARQAIEQYLDDLEDIYLAGQRLVEIRSGRTQTISFEDVLKQYGLED